MYSEIIKNMKPLGIIYYSNIVIALIEVYVLFPTLYRFLSVSSSDIAALCSAGNSERIW